LNHPSKSNDCIIKDELQAVLPERLLSTYNQLSDAIRYQLVEEYKQDPASLKKIIEDISLISNRAWQIISKPRLQPNHDNTEIHSEKKDSEYQSILPYLIGYKTNRSSESNRAFDVIKKRLITVDTELQKVIETAREKFEESQYIIVICEWKTGKVVSALPLSHVS
jgi:hypothetical protein